MCQARPSLQGRLGYTNPLLALRSFNLWDDPESGRPRDLLHLLWRIPTVVEVLQQERQPNTDNKSHRQRQKTVAHGVRSNGCVGYNRPLPYRGGYGYGVGVWAHLGDLLREHVANGVGDLLSPLRTDISVTHLYPLGVGHLLHAQVFLEELLGGHPQVFLADHGLSHGTAAHRPDHRLGQLLETQRVVRILGDAALLAHQYRSGGLVNGRLGHAEAYDHPR